MFSREHRKFLTKAGLPAEKKPQGPALSSPSDYRKRRVLLKSWIEKATRDIESWTRELRHVEAALAEAERRDGAPVEHPSELHTSPEHHKVREVQPTDAIQKRNAAISQARLGDSDDEVMRAARAEKNWSQNAIAEHLEVAAGTVSNWRKGHTSIPRKHAERLQRELGIPLSYWPKGVRG